MKIKKEIQAVCAAFGEKPGGYQSTWEDAQALAVAHSVGAVVRDFTAWLEENRGDDFPYGVVSRYVQIASDRLSPSIAPAAATLKDPEVVSLARELSYLSDGQIAFLDKQKIRLSEVLKEFTAEEITACFKSWLEEQDLSDLKNLSFLPGKFVQLVDGRAYALRKKRTEQTVAVKERAAAVIKLQQEAETARQESERARLAEENAFDPLSS